MLTQEWSEVVATTTAEYLKGAADLCIRDNPVFSMLNRRKRISYGQTGAELRWQVKFNLPDVEAYTGGSLDFAESDKHRQLVIDWRGYKVTDMMTEREKLENRGAAQLIDRYARIMPDMEEALMAQFGLELYVDGNTYTDRFMGLETMFGGSSPGGTCVVGDLVSYSTDSYGGYSMEPGAIAGAWSTNLATSPNAALDTDWPNGVGDYEYDFHAPRLVNWSSNAWGTGSTSWVDNCERALRRAAMWTQTNVGKQGKIDLFLMNPTLYYDYINRAASMRSIIVPAKELVELGFDGVQQEGVQLTHEYGVPEQTCYGLNLDKMELHMMYDNLFISKGPEYDMRTDSWLFMLATHGNWRFYSPKFFTKLYPYAAS